MIRIRSGAAAAAAAVDLTRTKYTVEINGRDCYIIIIIICMHVQYI